MSRKFSCSSVDFWSRTVSARAILRPGALGTERGPALKFLVRANLFLQAGAPRRDKIAAFTTGFAITACEATDT